MQSYDTNTVQAYYIVTQDGTNDSEGHNK